jgi:NADH dehydrogenase
MSGTAIPEVLVLGGGYGGVLAASRLAQLGRRARVTLVSDRDELVHRVRLHEALAGRPFRRYPLRELVPRQVRRVRGRVTRVSAADRAVVLAGGDALPFDYLLVALGSRLALGVPGARDHAAWLASPESALAGSARLALLPAGAPVVVIGGGLTAIETATEIAEAHPRLAVTMVARHVGPGLSVEAVAYLREVLADVGVGLAEGATATAVGDGAVIVDGAALPSALTVWAAGFAPAGPDLDTDLHRDDRGRLLVGADLRAAGCADVFVAGDAAAPPPGLGFHRMAVSTAMPMAAHAADGIAALIRGGDPGHLRFGHRGQCVSLGRRRALFQRSDPYDRPVGGIVTGRVAAMLKEVVCRWLIGALRIERRWPGAFGWPRDVEAVPPALAPGPGPGQHPNPGDHWPP